MLQLKDIKAFDEDGLKELNANLKALAQKFSGQLDLQNDLNVKVLDGETRGVAEEFAVDHGLKRNARGFVIVQKDKAGDIYKTSTQDDQNRLYLSSTVANIKFKILVF